VGNLLLARSRGRGCVATEWRFALNADGDPRTSLIPDVAFVSNERLALLGAEAREEPPFAPDIAVEVRSPDDRIADVEWKMNAYLAYGGVRAYSHAGLAVFARGERFACAEVPWFTFHVAEVFANLLITVARIVGSEEARRNFFVPPELYILALNCHDC